MTDAHVPRRGQHPDLVVLAATCSTGLLGEVASFAEQARTLAVAWAELCRQAEPVLQQVVDVIDEIVGVDGDWPEVEDPMLEVWQKAVDVVISFSDALPVVGGSRWVNDHYELLEVLRPS